jgi:alpha-beta hydrolase superfamily lysophospholipase
MMVDNPALRLFPPEDVYFKTVDGLTLHGWFFRAKDAAGSVLALHGNAENISTHVNSVLWLSQNGFNVFIFDYRGYGLSEGRPSIEGLHRDAEAALEKLMDMPGANGKIIVFGQSIGGAVAVNLVTDSPHRRHIKALVVDSSFAGYRLIAREKMNMLWFTWPLQYPLSWFFNDSRSPVKKIARVSPVPVLIMHGMSDPVVPTHHGEILFQAAREPKQFWLTTAEGHTRAVLEPAVREHLQEYFLLLTKP